MSAELSDGVARALDLVIRDYAVMTRTRRPTVRAFESGWSSSWRPDFRRAAQPTRIAAILRLPAALNDTESGDPSPGLPPAAPLPRLST